jgi:transposase
MMVQRTKRFKCFAPTNLDALVPAKHFYRQLEAKLDLSFVRDLVHGCYEELGRPSIDPVVCFKLHLIAFFEGISSERRLMETAQLNLAHHWYLGYDLDEPLPNNSSLSKIRSRYGVDAFQRFFERIVELCIEAGLVEGEELYFDAYPSRGQRRDGLAAAPAIAGGGAGVRPEGLRGERSGPGGTRALGAVA